MALFIFIVKGGVDLRIINNLSDIESLKLINEIPNELLEAIEQDLNLLFDINADVDDISTFNLPEYQALIVLEAGDKVLQFLNDPFCIEYVERHKLDKVDYFRIAKRNDHEFQLVYSQVNLHDEQTERWLSEQAEWNEGIGDFNV